MADSYYWLSFADEDGFRGACIVQADDFLAAIREAHRRGINPGGEVRGAGPFPFEVMNPYYHDKLHRLLKKEEIRDRMKWPRGEQ